ncbi:hypothetical protein Q8G81_33665, partial [Klebsiella pneumoniae]
FFIIVSCFLKNLAIHSSNNQGINIIFEVYTFGHRSNVTATLHNFCQQNHILKIKYNSPITPIFNPQKIKGSIINEQHEQYVPESVLPL